MQSGPETGNAACGHHNRAQTRLLPPEGETEPEVGEPRGVRGTPGPGSQGASCPAQASASEGLRRGSGPLPSVAPASAKPKGTKFPLLCAPGKHSAGRWSPKRGAGRLSVAGHCNGACCRPRSLSTGTGHAPDTAQDSRRAALPRGVISCCAENSRVPRRAECPEQAFHRRLRNALPFHFRRCSGWAEHGHRLHPTPEGPQT